jgi:hypothetical protein
MPRRGQESEEEALSIQALAIRWRLPAPIVRYELKRAGIKLTSLPRKPADGAFLRDVLALEEQVRAGIIASGIRLSPPKDAPLLRVVPNSKEQEAKVT